MLTRLRLMMSGVALLILPSLTTAQDSLPFPQPPSPSKAGPTIAQSEYKQAKPVDRLRKGAPNIVLIMLDDLGPALPSAFGGPINTPEDAAYINEHTDCVGFVGASSLERMAVEQSLTDLTRQFKAIPVKRKH